jgi:DNA-binding transcriptional ArsR family regulator
MIMNNRQTEFISDEIKRLTPVLGRSTAARLARTYLMGDETSRERIAEMLDIVKASVISDSDLKDSALMEPPETCEGELKLGSVLYGKKKTADFKIKKDQLLTHIGIFGSSGYGKTNLSIALVKQLSEQNVPVIIFDFSKRNYRDIEIEKEIYTVGRDVAPFRFNPLVPPSGISKSQWIKEFTEVFDHAYWLLGGGQHVILKALRELYEQKTNPRLVDLKQMLESYDSGTSRERNWLSTAMRPLESLDLDGIREVFDCEFGLNPAELLVPGKVTILELDALSTNDRTFFIEIFLQWMRDHLLVHGKREQLSGVILIEEAHHILNREKLRKLGAETVMDTIFREIRELGIGIIYSDQHPSLVSYPALGNTSMQVYMNLGLDSKYSSDIQDAGNMLGIKEEMDYLRRLPVGHGFVLIRNSSFPYTFLAEFDKADIKKGSVSDEEVMDKMRSKIKYEEKEENFSGSTDLLDRQSEKLLKAIGAGRGVTTSQLYKSVRMSGSTFNYYLSKLERAGLVSSREVRDGRARAKFCFLTKNGEKAIGPGIFSGTIQMSDIAGVFRDGGWIVNSKGDYFVMEKGENKIRIYILNEKNRAKIDSAITNGFHYLCGSEEIQNVLIQQAAAKRQGMIIYTATAEDFLRTGGFRAVKL